MQSCIPLIDIWADPNPHWRCPGTKRPDGLQAPTPNTWQTVEDDVYYVYSAHADPRMGNVTLVRIFGIMAEDRRHGAREGESYWCQVWTGEGSPPYVEQAKLYNQGHAKERYVYIKTYFMTSRCK